MAKAIAAGRKITSRDVLIALLEEGAGVGAIVVEQLGVSPDDLAAELRGNRT